MWNAKRFLRSLRGTGTDMDHHIPALDWSRSKLAWACPGPVGAGMPRYRPMPTGAGAAERSQEML